MKKRLNINKVNISNFVLIFILLFFIVVIARMSVLALSTNIDGINIKKFVSGRNTRKRTVYAKRGNIYVYIHNTFNYNSWITNYICS